MDLYKSYGIYGIRNKVNDKVYVGKTCANFGDRRDCHWASLRSGHGVNTHLQRSWDKYGEENFEFFIIYRCVHNESVDEVNELEKKFISQYRGTGSIYNISSGGDGGYTLNTPLSEETKRKIGEKNRINMTGRRASEHTKAKMSASQKERYARMTDEERRKFSEDISLYASGYKWSDESKKKFSEKQRACPNGAKYDAATVHKIRRMYEQDGISITNISAEMQIPRPTVYGIVTYKRWANI